MSTNRKVKVKSMVNNMVVISSPELRFRREFTKAGEIKSIDYDILEEMLTSLGTRTLFDEGILAVIEKQDRLDLGLQEEETPFEVLNDMQILGKLKTASTAAFREFMKNLPKVQRERVVDIAVDNKITDYEKAKIMKELTGKDVLRGVEISEEDEEEADQ